MSIYADKQHQNNNLFQQNNNQHKSPQQLAEEKKQAKLNLIRRQEEQDKALANTKVREFSGMKAMRERVEKQKQKELEEKKSLGFNASYRESKEMYYKNHPEMNPEVVGEYTGQGLKNKVGGRFVWDGDNWVNSNIAITKNEIKEIFPKASNENISTLEVYTNLKGGDFGIKDTDILAHFLSQTGHEVGHFSKGIKRSENMNYSVDGLIATFPKYFYKGGELVEGKKNASDYGRKEGQEAKQEEIANIVYGGRMGNGLTEGHKYRGRGIIQLTGKDNYENFNKFMQEKYPDSPDFVGNPDLLISKEEYSILSSMWFFYKNVIKKLDMDKVSVDDVTKKVNGKDYGIDDRRSIYNKAVSVLI